VGYKIKGGKIERRAKPPREALRALAEQRQAFVDKFGREPGPDDPLFFDPDPSTPQPIGEERLRRETLEAMRAAGIPPHLVYAYEKTGLMVNEHGYKNMTPEDRAEYEAAVKEYWEMEDEQAEKPVN
jgi:hypothetical protein